MKVISPDDSGAGHLHLPNDSSQYTTTNAHVTGEWTFFVNVATLGCLKTVNNLETSNCTQQNKGTCNLLMMTS